MEMAYLKLTGKDGTEDILSSNILIEEKYLVFLPYPVESSHGIWIEVLLS